MTGSINPGECPLCGTEADFSNRGGGTVTPEIDVPENVTTLQGHYDPENPKTTYYHFK